VAIRQRFQWSEERGKSRDLVTGRYISALEVRRAVDQTLRSIGQETKRLADDLRAGRISLDRFRLEMRARTREVHILSAAAARGGFNKMDAAAWGQVGGVIAEQDKFIDRFIGDIQTGKQSLNGQLNNRAAMYVEAGRTTHERAKREVLADQGHTEERNILRDAKHCGECPELTARGWVPLGSLPLPGQRECSVNCRCEIETRAGGTAVEEAPAEVQRFQRPSEPERLTPLPEPPKPPPVKVPELPTEEEIRAVDLYAGSHFGQVNRALRWGSDHELVPLLDSIAAKQPTTEPLVVYRGVGQGNAVASLNAEELRKLKGTVIEERGFSSTSTKPDVAVSFTSSATPLVLEVHVPAGTRAIDVARVLEKELAEDVAAGRVPRAAAKENEIILARGYKFRVGEVVENAFPSQFFGGLARHKLVVYLIP
jgi:hypothetical protein